MIRRGFVNFCNLTCYLGQSSRSEAHQSHNLPPVLAKLLLKPLRRTLLVGIVLILITVVLVIHVLYILLRLVLRPLAVVEVLALCLGKSVDFDTGEADKHLFGELMRDWLACIIR